jgi:hypothetical protein
MIKNIKPILNWCPIKRLKLSVDHQAGFGGWVSEDPIKRTA